MAHIVERQVGRTAPPAAPNSLTERMERTAAWLHALVWVVVGLTVLELFTIGGAASHQSGLGDVALLAILFTLAKGAGIVLVLRAIAFLLTNAAEQRPAELDAVAKPPAGVDLASHCSNCDAVVDPSATSCPTCGIAFDPPFDAQPAT